MEGLAYSHGVRGVTTACVEQLDSISVNSAALLVLRARAVPGPDLPHGQAQGRAAHLCQWQDRFDWCQGMYNVLQGRTTSLTSYNNTVPRGDLPSFREFRSCRESEPGLVC